jgi:hypothetical protein
MRGFSVLHFMVMTQQRSNSLLYVLTEMTDVGKTVESNVEDKQHFE